MRINKVKSYVLLSMFDTANSETTCNKVLSACVQAEGAVQCHHQCLFRKVRCSPTVPSFPASTTRDVCLPVAKELSTAFLAKNMAGQPCCSNTVCTICSLSTFVLWVGSANKMGCSFGSITSLSLHTCIVSQLQLQQMLCNKSSDNVWL